MIRCQRGSQLLVVAAVLAVFGPGCDPGSDCTPIYVVSFEGVGPWLDGDDWKTQEKALRSGATMTVRGTLSGVEAACSPSCGHLLPDVIQKGDARGDLCAGLPLIERAQDFQPGTPGLSPGAAVCLVGVFVVGTSHACLVGG